MPDPGTLPGADAALLEVLGGIRDRGAIGEASLDVAVAHADQFVRALPTTVRRLADLGSGGGLPGLVIAVRRPDLAITLVERRTARADLLLRATRALGLTERVTVLADDVRLLADLAAGSFDAVTARSFAAPPVTLRWASDLLCPGGTLVVSEPPEVTADRWPPELLTRYRFDDLGRHQGVRVFRRR